MENEERQYSSLKEAVKQKLSREKKRKVWHANKSV